VRPPREVSLDVFEQQRGWWGYHWAPPNPLSVTQLISAGSLDAELAALLWLLLEARLPLLIAAEPPLAGKSTTLTALLDFLPRDTERLFLRGWAEDFAWLPEARDLGWPPNGPSIGTSDLPPRWRHGEALTSAEPVGPADPARTYLLASELSSHLPVYTWGIQARVAIRAMGLGYGLGTSLHADSLEEVFEQLTAPPVAVTTDEVRRLGVVLVLRVIGPEGETLRWPEGSMEAEFGPLQPGIRRRVAVAHYLRPVERDGQGHLQRRPPAVLAAWDPAADCFEHFAWGITAELAARVGRSQTEFESEHRSRAGYLAGLVDAGITEIADVRRAIEGYRQGPTDGATGRARGRPPMS
jgi:hypothetical protein